VPDWRATFFLSRSFGWRRAHNAKPASRVRRANYGTTVKREVIHVAAQTAMTRGQCLEMGALFRRSLFSLAEGGVGGYNAVHVSGF
jgi:hypothetical protein